MSTVENREFLIFQFAVIVRLHLFDLSLGEAFSPLFRSKSSKSVESIERVN